jgi:hypothetical protein
VIRVLILVRASSKTNQVGVVSANDTDSSCGKKTNEGNEQTDAGTGSECELAGDGSGEPLSDPQERENQEQPSKYRKIIGGVQTRGTE